MQREARPPERLGRHGDPASALPHDPVDGGEAESGSTRVLGREEGVVQLGKDVDESPTRQREVDGAGRETRDGILEPHLRVEVLGVGLSDGVGEIEQDVARELLRFALASRTVELIDESEELDRQRRRPNEQIALSADLDRSLLGKISAIAEIGRDEPLGRHERGLHRRGYPHRGQRHRPPL